MSMKSPHMDLADMLAEINGELADERARAHLAACADCRAETEGWAAVAGGVGYLAASVRDPTGAIPEAALAPRRRRRRPRPRTLVATTTASAAAVVAAALVVLLPGHGRLTTPLRTPWQAAQALPQHTIAGTRAAGGAWRLASYLVTGWQRNTEAVSAGFLTCPAAGTCYVVGDSTASPSGAPDMNALYVSTNGGIGWSALPVPSGLNFTTALSCGSAADCAAGGLYLTQPVFADTSDGGHSWTIDPLPAAARGVIFQLSCPTSSTCSGLLATDATPVGQLLHGWFYYGGVRFLRTTDAGQRFAISRFPARQDMQALSCPTASDCVAIGVSRSSAGFNKTLVLGRFVETTTDGGANWTPGRMPAGLGLGYLAPLTCPDAGHCFMIGTTNQNTSNAFASSANGGRTWAQVPLPRDVPQPVLFAIACPTDSTCYVAGSEGIPQYFAGGGENEDSAMLLATGNAGKNWSRVTFAVPANVPAGYDTDAYMAIGTIQCPQAGTCLALGITDQGTRSTPVYTLGSAP
jgi:photosystem II stability/assembly factor-like uncharacterized protein